MRYFFISRVETNRPNINDYKPGNAVFNSMYVSGHLPDHWIKGDWTVILQLRNEFRTIIKKFYSRLLHFALRHQLPKSGKVPKFGLLTCFTISVINLASELYKP